MLNFSLSLPSGECIDNNFDQQPVEYVLGSGDMLPSFERELLGMRVGEEKTRTIGAGNAFGAHREENLQRFKPSHFDRGLVLVEGLVVAFADAAGAELPGVIRAINDDYIDVDFNHPLAGQDIEFKVFIHAIIDSPTGK